MKKILFVVDERKMGGVSVVLTNLFDSFKNMEFDLLVLHNNGNKLENIPNVNLIYGTPIFEVCDLNFSEILRSKKLKLIFKKIYLIFLLKTGLIKFVIKSERKKILTKKYDIEISFKDGIGTYFVAYGDSAEKIRWIHGDYLIKNPGANYLKTFKKALDKFDKIIAISKSVGEHFNEIFDLSSKTEIIYNIINVKNTLPEIKIKKESYDFEFISVGRLYNKAKGYDRLLKALKRLNEEGLFSNSILKIVGDGPDRTELIQMAKDFGLEERVIFFDASNKPWNYVQNGDLFLMTSNYEAFPTTVIESLINKIPVFALEYSSVYEQLNESNSVIVKNTDEALYNNLKKVLKKEIDISLLKKNLINYKYNNDENIKKIKKLFGESRG